jgi:hypothetical protein
MVYNWGVFDFSTPNFAWKFAQGRLNYMLAEYSYNRFLQEYMFENRSVWSQEVNLSSIEKSELIVLIADNLKEENRYYRYDFFYDNCSTRIRDLFEKVTEKKLIYPPEDPKERPTFNAKLSGYQESFPWLRLGVNLLMGKDGSKKADYRDRMFLPVDMMENLSGAVLNRGSYNEALLQQPKTVLEFEKALIENPFWRAPVFVFSMLFILIVFISAKMSSSPVINYFDILIFLIYSVIAVLMVFFNFFSDHQQMRMNANIIWFNPVIILCLAVLIFGKRSPILFRTVFFLSLVYLPWMLIKSDTDAALLPISLILALRSSARSEFDWNPFSV